MGKYALIKWKDGYQQVAALDEESKGILRYYVVERVETFGRLAIDSTAQYPGLKIIGRKPDQIESITLTEDGSAKVFTLTPKEDKAEGGRIDHHYAVKEIDNKVMDELVAKLKKIALEMGIDPKTAKEEDLEKIRKALGLSAFEKEAEVLSFIKMLLQKN
jgi:hypothetical protein